MEKKFKLIEDYKIRWSLKHKGGRIALKITGDHVYNDVPISSYEEFMAVANLLNGEKKVLVDFGNRIFFTVDSASSFEKGMKHAISDPSHKLNSGMDPWLKQEGKDDPWPKTEGEEDPYPW